VFLRRFFSSIELVVVELVSRGRIVIMAAFGGLGILMLSLVLFANSGQDVLKKVNIDLVGVKVLNVNKIDKRANLEVAFNVTNPTTITSTVPSINYDLFVNGKNVGSGHYSTEDIAMAGRAPLFPDSTITLTNTFNLIYTDKISNEYQAIINGQPVSYKATGQITVESAWTLITKDFESTFG
jgi:LEA14-like dessication related protein